MKQKQKIHRKLLAATHFKMRIRLYALYEHLQPPFKSDSSDSLRMFFIVGSQRSGSTLLRLVLNSHPDIYVREEDTSYKALEDNRDAGSKDYMGYKIPSWTYRYRRLNKSYPSAKNLFVHRDIRSIACSMITLKFGSSTWVEKYGYREIEKGISACTGKEKAFFLECYANLRADANQVALAGLCAMVKSYLLNEYRKQGIETIKIRYEDLIINPRDTLSLLLQTLGLPWHDNVLQHDRLHSGKCFGRTDAQRSIDASSLKKWENILAKTDRLAVESLVKSFVDTFGYTCGHLWDSESD
ncbi:MAG: hypothetical protein GF344_11285 [Chitinivibrionales bacterium]|nr:hypothetical protein [Chitinivibrionales bacterium]MBD3357385.1 hypothetical protein [Chitinivibrionales bacterium]